MCRESLVTSVSSIGAPRGKFVHIFLNYHVQPSLLSALQASLTAPNARSKSDHLFEQECVTLFSGFLHVLGVPKSIGGIYGLLYASPEPLCFADIVEKLEMSKGSVSQGIAFLRQSGAIKVVEVAGDRREFFEPELGLRRLASGLIKEKIQPLTMETKDALTRLKQHADGARGGQNEFQMERIKQLETWRRRLRAVLPVLSALLGPKNRK